MKSKKTIKILTTGLCCLMLTLSISTGVLNHNVTNKITHVFHIDMDMPD